VNLPRYVLNRHHGNHDKLNNERYARTNRRNNNDKTSSSKSNREKILKKDE